MGNNRVNYVASLTITLCLLLLPVAAVGTASALTVEYKAVDVSDPAPDLLRLHKFLRKAWRIC